MKTILLLLSSLFAVSAAGQAPPEKIVGGPFVVNVTGRNATIVWLVQSGEASVQPAPGGAAKVSPSVRVEKTTLTGLTPNTRYDYNVAAGDQAGKGADQHHQGGQSRSAPAGGEGAEQSIDQAAQRRGEKTTGGATSIHVAPPPPHAACASPSCQGDKRKRRMEHAMRTKKSSLSLRAYQKQKNVVRERLALC